MIWPISLHFAGEVSSNFDSRYVYKEAFDDQFLSRYFGGSAHGSLYRPRNPQPGVPLPDGDRIITITITEQ